MALAKMDVLGAVTIAASKPHCVARVSAIPKVAKGKFRIIFDLRDLNMHVRKTEFHYEMLASSRAMFGEGDWRFSFDLEAGYYHADVHPSR